MSATRFLLVVSCLLLMGGGTAAAQTCPTPSDVAGTWRWMESQKGPDGQKITPLSEGFELRLKLESDGRVVARVGLRESSGTYRLDCEGSTHTGAFQLSGSDLKLQAPLGELLRRPFRLSRSLLGELFLVPECLDCWSHTFVLDAPNSTGVEGLAMGVWKARWAVSGAASAGGR